VIKASSDRRERARRAALRALERARRAAAAAGLSLSDWESEFLGSVTERVEAYGRAFADPEKGGPSAALSSRQDRKLKEIRAKARGRPQQPRVWRRKRPAR